MIAKPQTNDLRGIVLVMVLSLLALAVSACERSEESFREQRNAQAIHPFAPQQQNARPSAQQNAGLIKRLEGAKEMDESEANQPGTSATAWQDDMIQVGKADKAIKELSHGLEVPQAEIDEALWVPPKTLSAAQKARLLQRLKDAVQRDENEEQTMMTSVKFENFPYPTSRMATVEDHKNLAKGVLKDLEIGEDVHWETNKQALEAPDLD
jgi:hypothetical protein